MRIDIIRFTAPPPECIIGRFLKVTFKLRSRAKALAFVVEHASPETQNYDTNIRSGEPWIKS